MNFNFHAHMAAFQEALLFRRSPEALQVALPRTTWHSFAPAQFGLVTNLQVKQQIMKQQVAKSSLVCSAMARRAEIRGAVFDRHAHMNCKEWLFVRGEPFTVISFNGPSSQRAVNACGSSGVMQHAHWWVTYVASDMHSHYTESLSDMMKQMTFRQASVLSSTCISASSIMLTITAFSKDMRVASSRLL